MEKIYFEGFGILEWLEPETYYSEPWKFLCKAEGDDGEEYDIVIRDDYPCKLRYTNI